MANGTFGLYTFGLPSMTSKSSGVIKNSFAISDFVAIFVFIKSDGNGHCMQKKIYV